MPDSGELNTKDISLPLALVNEVANPYFAKEMFEVPNIQGGPDITCQNNSGSLEGSNKSKKTLFIRSKIMGIN
jgi:hypothetical protein